MNFEFYLTSLAGVFLSVITLLFLLTYLFTFFTGGWYAPMPQKIAREMILTAGVGKEDFFADLGCGDGRLVALAAEKNARAVGFEINPFFYLLSFLRLKLKRLSRGKIELKNFWRKDLSGFNIVAVYLPPLWQGRLEAKLKRELKPGARIITYRLPLKSFKLIKTTSTGIFFYEI